MPRKRNNLKALTPRYPQIKISVIGRKSGPFSNSAVCRCTLSASSGLGCKIGAVLNQRGDSDVPCTELTVCFT